MQWRYATKQFDAEKKLSPAQLETLLETLRLAPSSFGLQPWKFIVVTNDEVRAKLREVAWNQPQITDASHLIVFAIKKDIDDALVVEYMQLVSTIRGRSIEDLKGFSEMLNGVIQARSVEENKDWATRQVYLSLGFLLAAAAVEGIDACPIEGFVSSKQIDEILGLEAMGLESKVLAAVGFRLPSDQAAQNPRVRFPKEEVFIEVK